MTSFTCVVVVRIYPSDWLHGWYICCQRAAGVADSCRSAASLTQPLLGSTVAGAEAVGCDNVEGGVRIDADGAEMIFFAAGLAAVQLAIEAVWPKFFCRISASA